MLKKIALGILLGGLFAGSAFAYDFKRIHNEDALGRSWLLFDEYTNAAKVEHFGGSTTPSGGSASVSDGFINAEGMHGNKYLSINLTAVTGTATFNVYTFFGTDSLDGTTTAVKFQTYNYTSATSTVLTIPQDCRGIALSSRDTGSPAGTHTFSAGVDYLLQRER